METEHSAALPSGFNEEISQRDQVYSLGENGGAIVPSPCSILRLSNACTEEDGDFLASEKCLLMTAEL